MGQDGGLSPLVVRAVFLMLLALLLDQPSTSFCSALPEEPGGQAGEGGSPATGNDGAGQLLQNHARQAPKLCVLTRTYKAHLSGALFSFLLSMAGSGLSLDELRVVLLVTDAEEEWDDSFAKVGLVVSLIHSAVGGKKFVEVLPLRGLPGGEAHNRGFAQTDRALREVFYNQATSLSKCEYLLVTNGDNYYVRDFATRLMHRSRLPKDFVIMDFVSGHTRKALKAEAKPGKVDLGATMWSLPFLQRHGLFYANAQGRWEVDADGRIVQRAARKTKNWVAFRETLFAHQ